MKKGTLLLLVAGVATAAVIALAGCSGNQAASNDQKTDSQSSAPAAASPAETSAAPQAAPAAPAETSPAVAPAPSTPAAEPAATQQQYIEEAKAKEIAFADAGVSEADVYDLEVKVDTDDAVIHFDVDFKANGMEYDYDLDPFTGEILKADSEIDD